MPKVRAAARRRAHCRRCRRGLGVFGGAAPVHVEVLGEGVEGEVARQDVEERAEGVGFEINAGGAGDFGVGVFTQGGADGLEEVEVFAEIPHAPFGAVDGVADFKEVGEGVGAVEGEGDHLTPSFGFADGAAVLDEGDGDAVALPVEEEGLAQRPLPGFQIFVVIEAEEERDFCGPCSWERKSSCRAQEVGSGSSAMPMASFMATGV